MDITDISCVVGGKRVVGSGTLLFQDYTDVEIFIRSWSCIVRFEDDGAVDAKYRTEIVDDKVVVKLINHRASLGESVTKPFSIAKMNDKSIYMTYETSLVNVSTSARRFGFTIWMDE